MKTLHDIVVGREPEEDERDTLRAVLEIAQAWDAGALPLAGVRSSCTGHDRWTAMRFAGVHNPQKTLLLRLACALVKDLGDVFTKAGPLTQWDLSEHGAWTRPDAHGVRVIQFKGLDEREKTYFRVIPGYKLAEGEASTGEDA
jgi:hypothetical protein